jgi:hypothetical protein
MLRLQLDRANAVQEFSAKYRIPADLSAAIYDIALSEGLDPKMAFQLVKVESDFSQRARSPMNAIGLTQIRLPTARVYEPDVTEKQLFDRELNLRCSACDLVNNPTATCSTLLGNRGPTVRNILGAATRSGYARKVLKGDPRIANVPVTVN